MLKLVTPPTVEPVTLNDVKAQAVIGHDADDSLLSVMITAVREQGESITNRSWAPQTLEVVLDAFPSWAIELPMGPVTGVTSVKYIDEDGVEKTLSSSKYYTDLDSVIARVVPAENEVWPDTQIGKPGAVRVRYAAGYTTALFPKALKQWMLIKIASLYAQRESHMVGFAVGYKVAEMDRGFCDGLLDRYRVMGSP
jgi:uncharacterized phiE125 gp8 family phage protein